MRMTTIYLSVLLAASLGARAQNLLPPPDPRESIHYWKPHIVAPEADALAGRAHRLFEQLLRAWDSQRVAPALHVVRSEGGPWAAALAEGHILLSRSSIDACDRIAPRHGDDLLAFVLAHELAHQRANDLWHFQFLRLAGYQNNASISKRMLGGMDRQTVSDIERREAQADHDGLVLMTTAGFDPYPVVGERDSEPGRQNQAGKATDFFTAWVENVWHEPCGEQNQTPCKQAQTRALRSRAQLSSLTDHAVLFQLGTQQFAAGRFEQARRFFAAFGREFPGRAVYFNIGLTHMAQALQVQKELLTAGAEHAPAFVYPVALDDDLKPLRLASEEAPDVANRGVDQMVWQEKIQLRNHHLDNAVNFFDRALQLQPQHKISLLMKAAAYQLQQNPYMTRGVLLGQYLKQFGSDDAAVLLLAMTEAAEADKHKQAESRFAGLMRQVKNGGLRAPVAPEVLEFSVAHNYAAALRAWGRAADARAILAAYAEHARVRGEAYVFQMSLRSLDANRTFNGALAGPALIHGQRLGDTLPAEAPQQPDTRQIWFEGDSYFVHRFADGATWISDAGKNIVGAWQSGGAKDLHGLHVGDSGQRGMQVLGLPSRRLQLASGEYMVYDPQGLGLQVQNGKITGWFLYQTSK